VSPALADEAVVWDCFQEMRVDGRVMSDEDNEHEPLSDEAAAYLETYERRREQGLEHFPFDANDPPFTNVMDPRSRYTVENIVEICRIVSSWYVKKANYYHDVTNLQVRYTPHDIKQVIVHRMREVFPKWTPSEQLWRDFFKLLLDPPVNKLNPELSIPVWSGKLVCLPANPQKVFFRDGTATVNIWGQPAYRTATAGPDTAFDEFLAYVIPRDNERDVFLNWLAWTLQHEGKKPSWAIMLYSDKQGTGKSTLADVLKALFGERNTGRTNGVGKLVGRFNKEILENKLVIVEEVEVKRGSPQANSIKSLITEDSTMVEAKGLPAYVEQIYCAFVMTTNHLPLWLEASDRRFYILNFDHQGYANGGEDQDNFLKLISNVKRQIKDPERLKGIYDTLMAREVTESFGDKLDIQQHRTEIMAQLQDLSPDVAEQVIAEALAERSIVFIPVEQAQRVLDKYARREINAQTHLFTRLGWKKGKFAWNGGPQKWAWYQEVDPKYPAGRGNIWSGHNWDDMADQVKKLNSFLNEEGP
jgi:hypothetical protein